MRGATLLLAACTVACGGGNGGPDVADAGPPDAAPACPLTPGFTQVMSNFRMLPGDEGFDLDGDGTPDNALGAMPDGVRDSINQGLADGVRNGEILMLFHFVDWSDPPTPDDPELEIWVLTGADGDQPPDPSDNFSGEDTFWALITQFDLNCQPRTATTSAAVAGGVLDASGEEWVFPLGTGTGSSVLTQPRVQGTFSADFTTFDGTTGFLSTLCSLSAIPAPGDAPGTTLDLMVNDPAIAAATQPDMDLDGDGIERVEGDGLNVARCIDGDGVTIIDGRDCPCHPAIADAYSSGFEIDSVRATLLGISLPPS